MLSRLRLLLALLVMAALPLQGLAAATMAFCGGPQHGRAHAAQPVAPAAHAAESHDHSVHAQGDHGGGAHADPLAGQASPSSLSDLNHVCGICAACCHGAAIDSFAQWPAFAPLPQASWAEPFVLIHATPSGVPDKPPRA